MSFADPPESELSPAADDGEGGAGELLLSATDVSGAYGADVVLRDVRFALHAGERVGVLGPNGGGKTTLFRLLLGELAPATGSLDVPRRCGVVPQTERSRLDFPVTALDVAVMGAIGALPWWRRPGREDRRVAREALREVGLDAHVDRSFGALSGGQRQRVLIARALVQRARVLLLDEPFSGLDSVSAAALSHLIDQLAARGHGILIATHDVRQASAWDLVLCLNTRQIAFGPPADVLTRAALEETYGAEILELPGGQARGIVPSHHHHHDA